MLTFAASGHLAYDALYFSSSFSPLPACLCWRDRNTFCHRNPNPLSAAQTNVTPTWWLLRLVSPSSKKAQFKLSVWIMADSRIIQAKWSPATKYARTCKQPLPHCQQILNRQVQISTKTCRKRGILPFILYIKKEILMGTNYVLET